VNPLHLVLAGAALAVGCTATPTAATPTAATPTAATPTAATPAATSGSLPAPTGFLAELEHRESPATGGQVAWESRWRLSWAPVAGATGYAVFYGSNEGGGGTPRAVRIEPSLTVQAAAGTSPRERLDQDRRAGLLLTSSQLLVSVSARGAGGQGPRSLWFPVGDVPPDGRPRGSAGLGEHRDG